jgi:ComF family protein
MPSNDGSAARPTGTRCGRRWEPNAASGARLVRALAELLLPRSCVACEARLPDEEVTLACGTCWSRLPVLPNPQCARCGYPLPEGECRWCLLLPPYVRAVRSVCWVPEGVGGDLVHAFKYDGWHALAPGLAARMARVAWPADVTAERTALVPVPLSSRRLRERGFNQSALLADALGARLRLDVWPAVLERTHFTSSQTRLTPEERLRNVSGVFRVGGDPARLRGAHLVLVDDVVTTAATLNACAAALFAGGARIISYVTFGRARLPGDAPP